MVGTLEVWERVRNMEDLEFSVLVLNSRGLEDAISAGLKRVETFVSASETHSLRNSGVSIDQALKSARGIIERAVSKGIKVTAGVMCAMGCVYEGAIDPGKVGGIFSSILDAGPTHISVADTTGMGAPDNVERIILELQNLVERDLIGFHLHDTYGLGLQNLERALEMGVTRFDASLAGLGGCPFVRGATGNISTERTVDFLNSKGFLTGIDQGGLTKARLRLQDALGKEIGKGESVNTSSFPRA
jgi:hydroxymethylglutaryl-CoA lyase